MADYLGVHPRCGSLEDVDRLVEESAARGMRVLLNLVPNHTSDEHPWFVRTRCSRDDPYRGCYIWPGLPDQPVVPSDRAPAGGRAGDE